MLIHQLLAYSRDDSFIAPTSFKGPLSLAMEGLRPFKLMHMVSQYIIIIIHIHYKYTKLYSKKVMMGHPGCFAIIVLSTLIMF